MIIYGNELYHHGIKGQKWGVRRYQNLDGTYTEEGKRRKYTRKDMQKDLDERIKRNPETYSRIVSNSAKISEYADKLSKEYEKELKQMQLSTEDRKRINKELEATFGPGFDDEEYFGIAVEDYVIDLISDKLFVSSEDTREEFGKIQNEYWKDVHSITDSLIETWSDRMIYEKDGYKTSGSNIIHRLIDKKMGTLFNSYIRSHFADYWVYDTDGFTDAVDRLSKEFNMQEYNRTHKVRS